MGYSPALYLRAIGDEVRHAKTILQIHGNYAEEAHNRDLLIESLACIDGLQIVSESMRDGIRQITSFEDERVHYIPNVHFPTAILRRKRDSFTASVIGSLQDRKNQVDAVKAVARLPSVRLDIWGNAGNDYGKFIRSYINNLDLSLRLKMRGIGTEQQIYEGTDLAVITSKHEGFGYTMIEAATHGIPTVAYDYEFGAREFIEDGVNGFLVPMGDIETLAARISRLSESPSLCNDLGEAALATYRSKFSPERILSLYENLIDKESPNRGRSFTSAFLRDGEVPFDPSSISIRTKSLFGHHYAKTLALKPREGQKIALYMMKGKGKPTKVKTVNKNDEIIAQLPIYSSLRKRTPNKYLLAAKSVDGAFSYVVNTTKAGHVERLSEFSRVAPQEQSWQERFTGESVFIASKGSYLRYGSFEPIRSVHDETGQPITFKTVHLNRAGEHGPYLAYSGEFSSLTINYGSGRVAHVAPPTLSYKELFLKLLDMENKYSFLQYEVGEFRPWELIRASVLEYLAMAFGLWGPHFDESLSPSLGYYGKKMISQASSAGRLIFEFTRKGDIDQKTFPLRTGDEIIVEYPQTYGYTVDSYIDGPVYPIHEFYTARKRVSLASNQKYKGDFFEPIFAKEFGISMSFTDIINGRLLKFKQEHHFWSKIFDETHFSEVVIPSAYWSAGICHAARQHGIIVSDIQYALIAYLHPTNTFTSKAAYTPDNIYAWSSYWADSATKYRNKSILPRKLPEVIPLDLSFDFCVLSQPRVKKRIADFLITLAQRNPSKRIAYCLHPDEPIEQVQGDPRIAGLSNVEIFRGDTFNVMAHSEICVGGYSTSLYEAAYLGKPTYVIPVPGWEVVEQAIEEGMFRVVNDPDELVAFRQTDITKALF